MVNGNKLEHVLRVYIRWHGDEGESQVQVHRYDLHEIGFSKKVSSGNIFISYANYEDKFISKSLFEYKWTAQLNVLFVLLFISDGIQ